MWKYIVFPTFYVLPNMYYKREIHDQVKERFFQGKIIIITGARQVWKTRLVHEILREYPWKHIDSFSGDFLGNNDHFFRCDVSELRSRFHATDIIFIDEWQRIENIGISAKILVDLYGEKKQIIITGSSSFNLLSHVSESLTGRKEVFHLFPLSFQEISQTIWFLEAERKLESGLLLTGMFPKVISNDDILEQKRTLEDIATSSLYRDILEFQWVRNSDTIRRLLQLLAIRIWQETQLSTLGKVLSLDGRTVERYIDLLEKSYIIYRLPPFFRNKEKEVTKTSKIYFYDIGIRNALLNDFTPLSGRSDLWRLWENWVISERKKRNTYSNNGMYMNFWRGRNQQEVDLVDEGNGEIHGYEIKWREEKKRIPSLFSELYPEAVYHQIIRSNYWQFL